MTELKYRLRNRQLFVLLLYYISIQFELKENPITSELIGETFILSSSYLGNILLPEKY